MCFFFRLDGDVPIKLQCGHLYHQAPPTYGGFSCSSSPSYFAGCCGLTSSLKEEHRKKRKEERERGTGKKVGPTLYPPEALLVLARCDFCVVGAQSVHNP